MKQYLQKKIKQFWNTSKQIVSNLFEKKLVKKTFNPYKNIPDPKLVFKDTLGMKDINRDSKIPENLKNILAEIENMGDRLRKLGESDGPYQMRYQTIREKVKSTASRTSKYIETIFKGISESVTNEIKVKKEKEQQIQNDIDATENYLKDLIKAKYWNPKNYLLWEAIIFLIFGLGLLAGVGLAEYGYRSRAGVRCSQFSPPCRMCCPSTRRTGVAILGNNFLLLAGPMRHP